MKHRLLSLIAALAVGGATLGLAASAAGATTELATDARGDSASTYADITAVGVSYNATAIGVGLFTVNGWSPSTWTSDDAVNFEIETTGDSTPDYEVWWTEDGASVYTYSASSLGTFLCTGSTSFDPSDNYYFVGFPASCVNTPDRARVQGYIHLGYNGAYDFAPSTTTFSPFALRDGSTPPPPPPPPPPAPVDPPVSTAGVHDGYWMLTGSGSVFGFGSANSGTVTKPNNLPFVDVEPTPSGNGYWALDEGGAIVAKGDATAFPPIGVLPGEKAVSLSGTPSGRGLWIFTSKGRVIVQGDAQFFGDMSGTPLNGAVLGSVATPTGNGYWMVASDGGIFSFGDAQFHGSTGNLKLNKPVMAMAPAKDGSGYWLVASDGGIFAFGVPFYGSMGGTPLNKPISGMVPGDAGYMMVGQDGGIFSFGSVAFHGSLGSNPPPSSVVSVALQP